MPSVQKAESVMVWAAMKKNGAVCLRRCPPRMNAAAYQDILESAKAFIRPRYVRIVGLVSYCDVCFTVRLAGAFNKMALQLIALHRRRLG